MEKRKFELLKEYLQKKKKLYRWAIETLKKVHKKEKEERTKKDWTELKKARKVVTSEMLRIGNVLALGFLHKNGFPARWEVVASYPIPLEEELRHKWDKYQSTRNSEELDSLLDMVESFLKYVEKFYERMLCLR